MPKPRAETPGGRATTARELRWAAMTASGLAMKLRGPMAIVADRSLAEIVRDLHVASQRLYDLGVEVELGRLMVATADPAEAEADPMPLLIPRRGPEPPAPAPGPLIELDLEAMLTSGSDDDAAGEDLSNDVANIRRAMQPEAPGPFDPDRCPALDVNLYKALTRRPGARARWEKRRAEGATLGDLYSAIGVEVPSRVEEKDSEVEVEGIGTIRRPGYAMRAYPDPAFWHGEWKRGSLATLRGPDLIAAVRRVMEVPEPGPTPARRKNKGAKAGEARP